MSSVSKPKGWFVARRREWERRVIRRALRRHSTVVDTARALGINRDVLYKKMRQYGITGHVKTYHRETDMHAW